jgi:DNA-binding MarR family transcriptional regulator
MHRSVGNALSAWLLLGTDAADSAASEAADLPVRGLSALVLLRNRPGCNGDWLYRRLGISQSGAVRLIDRLEKLGLLRRERSRGRREVDLYVTPAGESRLRQGLEARETAIRALLEPLTEEEQRQLAALIVKALAGGTRRRADADIACRLCDWDVCKPGCPLDASVIEAPGVRE